MIDLRMHKLRERIDKNEYVPYKNNDGTRVINVCGTEIDEKVYNKLTTELYSTQNQLKMAIQKDISDGKVKEGYCIPGGILGLQILLIGADNDLLLEAQDVVKYSIETLKQLGRNQELNDTLKNQAQALKQIQSFFPLFVATSENQKEETKNLFQ